MWRKSQCPGCVCQNTPFVWHRLAVSIFPKVIDREIAGQAQGNLDTTNSLARREGETDCRLAFLASNRYLASGIQNFT